MATSLPPDPRQPLPAQLKALRQAEKRSLLGLAERTGLSRLTVAAAEGRSDTRLSSMVALFDELGYVLVPVPKPLLDETAAFLRNQGQTVSLPAGVSAPLGVAQRVFLAGRADNGRDGDADDDALS